MLYASKDQNGVWSTSEQPFDGAKRVLSQFDPPVFVNLVLDVETDTWVDDPTLTQAYLTSRTREIAIQLRLKKQSFGSEFLARVVELNVQKYVAGTLTLADLNQMDLDTTLQAMERAAWRGNLTTLKALIQNYNGIYYTTQEKADLVALIDGSGLL